MAPRLRPCSLAAALPCCPSTIPQSTSLPTHTSRAFSQTCYRQVTARRRRFYEWLNGPGAQVKRPLPKSTNYLGAYDSYGNLIRAEPGYQRGREEPEKKTEDAAEEAVNSKGEETPQGQEQVDELELAVRRDEEKSKDNLDDANKLPPETIEDLRPFPLNKYFRSQPVLSEDLREAIYHRVTRDGATVPLASVEFGVSNERVGAVVRLKQLEKEWVAQVCSNVPLFSGTST